MLLLDVVNRDPGPIPTRRVPPGAVPGNPATRRGVDPVRRRCQTLHRRRLRDVRTHHRAAHAAAEGEPRTGQRPPESRRGTPPRFWCRATEHGWCSARSSPASRRHPQAAVSIWRGDRLQMAQPPGRVIRPVERRSTASPSRTRHRHHSPSRTTRAPVVPYSCGRPAGDPSAPVSADHRARRPGICSVGSIRTPVATSPSTLNTVSSTTAHHRGSWRLHRAGAATGPRRPVQPGAAVITDQRDAARRARQRPSSPRRPRRWATSTSSESVRINRDRTVARSASPPSTTRRRTPTEARIDIGGFGDPHREQSGKPAGYPAVAERHHGGPGFRLGGHLGRSCCWAQIG